MRIRSQDGLNGNEGEEGDEGVGGAVPDPLLTAAKQQQPEVLLVGTATGIANRAAADPKAVDTAAGAAADGATTIPTLGREQYDGYMVEWGPQISVDYEHPLGTFVAMKSAHQITEYVDFILYGVSMAYSRGHTGPLVDDERMHATGASSAGDDSAETWARRLLDADAEDGYYIEDGKYFVESGPHIEVEYGNGVPMADYEISPDYLL